MKKPLPHSQLTIRGEKTRHSGAGWSRRNRIRTTRLSHCIGTLTAIALLTVTILTNGSASAQSGPLVITNFSYFDSYSKTMASARKLVIENGKIVSIDDDDHDCIDCQTIDLSGGFIIPGLIDLHQHLGSGGFASQDIGSRISLFHKNLYWGVTAVLNPGIPEATMAALKKAIGKNPARYPRFLTTGQIIGPKGGWGDLKTATVGGLKAAINAQIKAGASIIKLSYDDKAWLSGKPLPLFSEGAITAAINHAHQRERRVFVHTTQVALAKKAISAGADGIIAGLAFGKVDNELISMMKNRRTVYVATLSAFAAIADNAASAKRQMAYDPARVNSTGLYQSLQSPIMRQNWRDWWPLSYMVPRQLKTLHANTKALVDAGATVGIGSDGGTPGVVFGASLPDELERHVALGLHPAEAIHMATTVNARILFLGQITGTIEVGKAADLVLLSEDPSQSIEAMKSILYTVRGGRLYDRREF